MRLEFSLCPVSSLHKVVGGRLGGAAGEHGGGGGLNEGEGGIGQWVEGRIQMEDGFDPRRVARRGFLGEMEAI